MMILSMLTTTMALAFFYSFLLVQVPPVFSFSPRCLDTCRTRTTYAFSSTVTSTSTSASRVSAVPSISTSTVPTSSTGIIGVGGEDSHHSTLQQSPETLSSAASPNNTTTIPPSHRHLKQPQRRRQRLLSKNQQVLQKRKFPRTWVPLASIYELDPDRPTPLQFLDQNYVCYQGSANTNLYNDNDNNNTNNTVDLSEHWVVMDDVCAHRLVPLSEGRINRVVAVSSRNNNNNSNSNTPANGATTTTTTLQCSYHGWEFDGNHQGQCVNIPQATSKKQQKAFQSPRSCVTSYSVRVHKNVLWCWPWPEDSLSILQDYPRKHPEGMMESIAREPPGTGGAGGGGNNHNTPKTYTRDLPYGWDTLVENLIDPAHIPFAHHNLQGKREDAIPIEMTVPEAFPNTTLGTNTTTTGSNSNSNTNDGDEGGFFFEWQDRTMGKFRGGIGEFNAPFGVAYEGIYYKTKEKADAARGSHIAGKRILLQKKAAAAAAAMTSTNHTETAPYIHEDDVDDEDDRGDSNNNNNNNNAEEEPDLFQLGVLCIPTKPGWSRAIILTGGGSSTKEDTQTEKRYTTNIEETPLTTKSLSKTKDKKKKKSLVGLIFSALPPWVIHLLSNKFLDSDLAFLHYQEQERLRYRDDNNDDDADDSSGSGSGSGRTASSPLSAHYFMPAASDRCIAALGKWIPKHTDYLGGDGSGDSDHNHNHKYTLPPPISSRTELFNRYKQHTSHCRHCQQGLKTLQTRVRRGTYGALIVSVLAGHFASPPAPAAAGFFRGFRFMTKITALLSLGILRLISKIEAAFNEGEFKHYENN